MGKPATAKARYTWDEYHAWPDDRRWELIEVYRLHGESYRLAATHAPRSARNNMPARRRR
jgi:hypothetical protein